MSQRKTEPILPAEGITFWRAGSYRVSGGWIEAEPGAIWEPASPVAFYKLAGKKRELEAGPHLMFLKLRGLLRERFDLFGMAATLFANEVGLVGIIHETFSLPPSLPAGKLWVAPEAVVEGEGGLRRLNPETEGVELLLDLLDRQGYFSAGRLRSVEEKRKREAARSRVAMPSEVMLTRKDPTGPWPGACWSRTKAPPQGSVCCTLVSPWPIGSASWRTSQLGNIDPGTGRSRGL
jgi:hypothetical protein